MEDSKDLISRQAAIDVIDAIFPVEPMKNEYTQGITCGAALAKEYIKQLPPAQPERKKGKWMYDGDCYICDQCKSAFGWWADSQTSNYCPNCGADMRGEQNE